VPSSLFENCSSLYCEEKARITHNKVYSRTACMDEIILTVQKEKSFRHKDVWETVGKIRRFVNWQ